jgi:hydrogenase small subunit
MRLDRRDFMKASAALGGAMTLKSTGLLPQAMAATGPEAPPVIWLQGQSCTGCSVSFLNSIYYTTADDLLLNQLDVRFQSNVMAAAGDLAVDAAVSTPAGYVLILEGAIPFGANGEYCHLWENTSMVDALQQFAPNAGAIIALGTCACYGGMYAATPNPTETMGVKDALSRLGINKSVINIPGCPAHPDWLVGTVATLLAGQMPTLDSDGRPVQYYPKEEIHEDCPFHEDWDEVDQLGQVGCLEHLGCRGKVTHADCHYRKWNSGAPGEYGEEWCIGAGAPCIGCTEPGFPDTMTPFYKNISDESDDDDHHEDDDHSASIEITGPESNSAWLMGSTYAIQWTGGNTSQYVKIQLFKGSTLKKTIADKTANDGHYNFKVPYSLSQGTNYKIKVKVLGSSDSSMTDYSAQFTIALAAIEITSPASSTEWSRGVAHKIRWTGGKPKKKVKIKLLKAGVAVKTLTKSTLNDGVFKWRVPSKLTPRSDYSIKVVYLPNTAMQDTSDVFTVTKSP